jgi:hypothetical protein
MAGRDPAICPWTFVQYFQTSRMAVMGQMAGSQAGHDGKIPLVEPK